MRYIFNAFMSSHIEMFLSQFYDDSLIRDDILVLGIIYLLLLHCISKNEDSNDEIDLTKMRILS